MLRRMVALTLVAVISTSALADEWRPLFNGKDLKGWTAKICGHVAGDNYGNTFRVEDGLLKVRFDQYEGPYDERFGHLFYNETFSHYRLRVVCRSTGQQVEGGPGWARRNNGLMLHCQTPESMLLEQRFPVSLELQILTQLDEGRPRPTANLCTPGTLVTINGNLMTDHCTNSSSNTIPDGEWVTIEAEVHGDQMLRHFVNGEQVLEYANPILDPKDVDAKRLLEGGATRKLSSGAISIQSESGPFDFRTIEIKVLRP